MSEDAQTGEVTVTDNMIDSLRSTKPWTKLLSILGFVGTGFMILFGVGFMFFTNALSHQTSGFSALVELIYLLFAVLYFVPAFYLFRYSSSLGNFLKSNGPADLESALSHQKSFWKFTGIVVLIHMVLVVLGIAAAFVLPMLSGILAGMGAHHGM